ncbi:MAG: arsenate reductase ArsC [Parvibaculum sp.]|uniref:arsenate reductase ArsC n=1 Tax=Parvibaculum sp. TaxID=2024848 RepID=UPI0025E2BB38|nr:arsenate reductase ArsC [Parvibaculum sp.]MCE9648721.1 arsenate reductase ArsC [Parvibaculum sp.]
MTEADRVYNVLFLCTGNSARSILAESYMNAHGQGRFRAFSAGSHPGGTVNRFALEVLGSAKLPVEGLRSKSWDEFAAPGAPHMDFVFTVCDNAAGEVCPIWPGQPMSAHWPFEDPAAFVGSEDATRRKFVEVFMQIRRRIDLFTSLPLRSLDKMALKRKLDELGRNMAGAD